MRTEVKAGNCTRCRPSNGPQPAAGSPPHSASYSERTHLLLCGLRGRCRRRSLGQRRGHAPVGGRRRQRTSGSQTPRAHADTAGAWQQRGGRKHRHGSRKHAASRANGGRQRCRKLRRAVRRSWRQHHARQHHARHYLSTHWMARSTRNKYGAAACPCGAGRRAQERVQIPRRWNACAACAKPGPNCFDVGRQCETKAARTQLIRSARVLTSEFIVISLLRCVERRVYLVLMARIG
jgi:hypothetical protein